MKVLFFTGAGMSAESGIPTYRDSKDGLWNNHKVEEVATLYAYNENPAKVTSFLNEMANKFKACKPNSAHYAIYDLEEHHEVVVVTQNIDNLHEKAGSFKVIHLHGNIFEMKTSALVHNPPIYSCFSDIKIGDLDPIYNSQFRHNVVLFGENVPNMSLAAREADEADVLVVIGTGLEIFPAASIVEYFLHDGKPVFYIDPNPNEDYVM